MFERRVARRYAKALIESVGAENIQTLDKDISLAEALWTQSPVIRVWFLNPAIKKHERMTKIEKIINNIGFSNTMKNFFRLLALKNRLNLLPEIIQIVRELSDETQKRVRAELITARGIKKENIEAIKKSLEEKLGKEILIKPEMDKKIIGGAILRIKGTIFDGSLITRLNRLKEKLKEEGNGITG
jgi:F-type H+-transporting ATPase subunit delta